MDKIARILVSSTFKALEDCREKVRLILRRMGHEDLAMEYFCGRGQKTIDKCLQDFAFSDL